MASGAETMRSAHVGLKASLAVASGLVNNGSHGLVGAFRTCRSNLPKMPRFNLSLQPQMVRRHLNLYNVRVE